MVQQNDKKMGRPKVWIYRDKATGLPKGEATITYEDDQAASSAIEWFNSKNAAYLTGRFQLKCELLVIFAGSCSCGI